MRLDRMMEAMHVRRDDDPVDERRNPERDVGVSQCSDEHFRDELPGDESRRHPEDQKGGPDEHTAPQEVDHVMPGAFERVQSKRRVMNRVRGPEPGERVGEAMVPVPRKSPRTTTATI